MKEIKLTRGRIALVDDEDFNWLNQWKWNYQEMQGGGKAARKCRCFGDNREHNVFMHRQITSCPSGLQIDHINHNTLDNRRCNLRICTRSQNNANRKSIRGTVPYKGVCKRKDRDTYCAEIVKDGKRYRLGTYDSPIKAAEAYNKKAKELFGEFAYINNL